MIHVNESEYEVRDAWWCIHSEALFEALVQVQGGTDPEVVYQRLYDESETEDFSVLDDEVS